MKVLLIIIDYWLIDFNPVVIEPGLWVNTLPSVSQMNKQLQYKPQACVVGAYSVSLLIILRYRGPKRVSSYRRVCLSTGVRTRRRLWRSFISRRADAAVRWRYGPGRFIVVVARWVSVAARGQHAPAQLQGGRRSTLGARRASLHRQRRHRHGPRLVRVPAQLVAGSRRRISLSLHLPVFHAGY